MTPQARTQGAIEALDLVIAAARDGGAAADTVIDRLFAARRFMGSGDRRAVRALVYDVIRTLGERPASGRAALIGHACANAPDLLAHFGAGGHAPAPLVPGEVEAAPAPVLVPAWQAFGGVRWEISKDMGVMVTYKYLATGNFSFNGQLDGVEWDGLESTALNAGLNFRY